MRIALYHNLPSGGARRFVHDELRELAGRGHEITEFTTTLADRAALDLGPWVIAQQVYDAPAPEFTPRRLPMIAPYVHAAQLTTLLRRTREVDRRIAADIDAHGYDVVLAQDSQIIPSPYLLRYVHTPTVFQCHHVQRDTDEQRLAADERTADWTGRLKRSYYAPARAYSRNLRGDHEQVNLRAATLVLTNSEYSRSVLAARFGVESTVIYPGIDSERFCPGPIPRGEFVLAVGALHYMKGYRFLVSALGQMPAQRRPALVIAANSAEAAEQAAVTELAARLGVSLRIENVRDDARMVELYRTARAFVYTPIEEALGLAPLEAMACGTPVLAVGEAGVLETVVDGVTGWLVGRDAHVFAERLDALLRDDTLRARFAEQAVDYVREKWTWSRAVDQLEAALAETAKVGRK